MSCPTTTQSPPEPCPTAATTTQSSPEQQSNADYCILCVGYCILDLIHLCDAYPEEDVKKLSISGHWQRGGNCSNMCTVLRRMDVNCEFLGMMSSSPGFAVLLQDCKNRGIVTKNCPTTPQEPPFATIVISKATGSRTIIHSDNNFPILTHEAFSKIDLRNYTWINIEAKNPEEISKILLDICTFNLGNSNCSDNQDAERKITISLDLERIRPGLVPLAEYVDYVILGKDLAKHLGWNSPCEAVYGLRGMLKTQEIVKHRKPNIIAPWSDQGAAYLSSNDEYELVAAYPPKEIVDTLGAGDTFASGFVFAKHVQGKNLRDAVIFANRLAGFKIGHKGYDDIRKFYVAELTNCTCSSENFE